MKFQQINQKLIANGLQFHDYGKLTNTATGKNHDFLALKGDRAKVEKIFAHCKSVVISTRHYRYAPEIIDILVIY